MVRLIAKRFITRFILCQVLRMTLRPLDISRPIWYATLRVLDITTRPDSQSTGVRVELAATRRTGLHRYTFPSTSIVPRILLDVTNDGQISTISPELTINPKTGRMIGAFPPPYSGKPIHVACSKRQLRDVVWPGAVQRVHLRRLQG